MPKQQVVTQYDDAGFPQTAAFTTPITTAGTVTVKAGPGRLVMVSVTASAAGLVTIYDNASAGSGLVLLAIPASPAAGTVYNVNLPALNGITVVSASTPSSVTIGYS